MKSEFSDIEHRILDALLRLEVGVSELKEKAAMQGAHVDSILNQNEDHERRLRALEEHKAKAVVIFGGLSLLGSAVVTGLVKLVLG